MPFNAQGIFTLDPTNPVTADTVIEPTWANPTLADIATALSETLIRDGRAPMTQPLVLSGNVSAPLAAVPYQQVQSLIAAVSQLALSDAVPNPGAAIGLPGTSQNVSRWDHVHPLAAALVALQGLTTQQTTDLLAMTAFGGAVLKLVDAAAARTALGLPTATQAEMAAGTETALRAMSPKLAAGIGAGQTWQTKAGATFGVTYANTTERAITVSVTVQLVSAGTTSTATAKVGTTSPPTLTIAIASQTNTSGTDTSYMQLSFIVPAGQFYIVDTNGAPALGAWVELK